MKNYQQIKEFIFNQVFDYNECVRENSIGSLHLANRKKDMLAGAFAVLAFAIDYDPLAFDIDGLIFDADVDNKLIDHVALLHAFKQYELRTYLALGAEQATRGEFVENYSIESIIQDNKDF